jgi:energy-coupling factor transport system permease protein
MFINQKETASLIDARLLIIFTIISTIYLILEQTTLKFFIMIILVSILILIRHIHIFKYILFLCFITGVIFFILFWFFLDLSLNNLIIMYLRFISVSTVYILFYSEITPENLTIALIYFKIPYRFAWTISTAFRYIFLFVNDSKELKNALLIRGVPIDGNIIQRIRFLPLVISLLIFRTNYLAYKFSEALFSKNWSPYTSKTFFRNLNYFGEKINIIITFLLILVFVGFFYIV